MQRSLTDDEIIASLWISGLMIIIEIWLCRFDCVGCSHLLCFVVCFCFRLSLSRLLLSSWFMIIWFRQRSLGVDHWSSRGLFQWIRSRLESGQVPLRRCSCYVFPQTFAVSLDRLRCWCSSRVCAESVCVFDPVLQGPSFSLRWQRLGPRDLHSHFWPIDAPSELWHLIIEM